MPDIDENRLGPGQLDATSAGDKRVGRGDNLIAWPDIERTQGNNERIRPGVDTHGIADAAKLGEAPLELGHRFSEDKISPINDAFDRLHQLHLDGGMLAGNIYIGNVSRISTHFTTGPTVLNIPGGVFCLEAYFSFGGQEFRLLEIYILHHFDVVVTIIGHRIGNLSSFERAHQVGSGVFDRSLGGKAQLVFNFL